MAFRRTNGAKMMPPEFFENPGAGVVSTYDSEGAAQHAIDILVADGFAANGLSIIGRGVHSVEKVIGRVTYAKVALGGVFSGVYLGIGFTLVALLLGIVKIENVGGAFGGIMIIGIGAGVLLAILTQTFAGARKRYTSVTRILAERYEIVAPAADVTRARSILQEHAIREHS
ncbi:hypothetical protein KJY78_01215 [Canibacter sp. lx-45]|uniref:general stress protein n=1 Tax=Canibacter zhuwentaonis TaxID=2837491 RepID=UPI001BDCA2BA|nr:general stress protein [Canibacter zhuwentaonis]MBT1034973.1 hypothetical protein [Canibacter zhuwentaonis]